MTAALVSAGTDVLCHCHFNDLSPRAVKSIESKSNRSRDEVAVTTGQVMRVSISGVPRL